MKDIINKIDLVLEGEMWSGKVQTKWHPPEGLFTRGATKISSTLFSQSDSLKQAMSRLNFYINRAGGNLPPERLKELNKAKGLLRKRFSKDESE